MANPAATIGGHAWGRAPDPTCSGPICTQIEADLYLRNITRCKQNAVEAELAKQVVLVIPHLDQHAGLVAQVGAEHLSLLAGNGCAQNGVSQLD